MELEEEAAVKAEATAKPTAKVAKPTAKPGGMLAAQKEVVQVASEMADFIGELPPSDQAQSLRSMGDYYASTCGDVEVLELLVKFQREALENAQLKHETAPKPKPKGKSKSSEHTSPSTAKRALTNKLLRLGKLAVDNEALLTMDMQAQEDVAQAITDYLATGDLKTMSPELMVQHFGTCEVTAGVLGNVLRVKKLDLALQSGATYSTCDRFGMSGSTWSRDLRYHNLALEFPRILLLPTDYTWFQSKDYAIRCVLADDLDHDLHGDLAPLNLHPVRISTPGVAPTDRDMPLIKAPKRRKNVSEQEYAEANPEDHGQYMLEMEAAGRGDACDSG